MVDPKDFMAQFLQYLQTYYGGKAGVPVTTAQTNILKMPIFQEGMAEVQPEPQFGGMPQGMGQDMGMAQQLNGLFPGPNDPMRLN
jgi:hypothetical protein